MENKENKIDFQEVLTGLHNTASMLNSFIAQTREGLPKEQQDLLDSEIKKAQSDLSKVMDEVKNFKL
jgi:hypothetical protein